MRPVLIALSGAVTVAAIVPYVLDILRRKTKPRVVSWFTWSLLTGISAAASFSDHQLSSAVLAAISSVDCMLVVILGLWYGDKKIESFDIACLVGALVGLGLWLIFNSPAVAVVAAIVIDFIGSVPTLRHAWEKPDEETWATFAASAAGAVLAAAAAASTRITALANPIYIVLINLAFTIILLGRRTRSASLLTKH